MARRRFWRNSISRLFGIGFRNHPVRIEMVSRFLTAKEIAEVLQQTAEVTSTF